MLVAVQYQSSIFLLPVLSLVSATLVSRTETAAWVVSHLNIAPYFLRNPCTPLKFFPP